MKVNNIYVSVYVFYWKYFINIIYYCKLNMWVRWKLVRYVSNFILCMYLIGMYIKYNFLNKLNKRLFVKIVVDKF